MALAKLGKGRITSFSDATESSQLCALMYPILRDEVLMAVPWSFAIRRSTLSLLATTPNHEFAYEHQLPTNPKCLRLLEIEGERDGYEYTIEDDKLLSDDSVQKVKYIAQITTTGDFSPMFTSALIARLASELAYPVTGSAAMQEAMFRAYTQILNFAGAIDTQQGSSEIITSNDLTEIR